MEEPALDGPSIREQASENDEDESEDHQEAFA
jgi:hypothetical protein